VDYDDRVLQACASEIRDPQRELRGTVVVFNDVTRMRKLELTRREFVANVSHELKTPVTSIKGYVETLRDDSAMSAEETERFLGIIARQADQLTAIIEDLLDLARIEREAESGTVKKESCSLSDLLHNARMLCEKPAEERGIVILLDCPHDLTATVNARLMEQAVVNLIDNAIKYGRQGGAIHVQAAAKNEQIEIKVRDDGPGIASEHIPRLFERFYRIDLSRSREYGGTGLGLAIVKHIALAHTGTASVDTIPGKGSAFTIRFSKT
jgi:two-component system phosphate regulon sensor histidine kinase PhoR